MTDHDVPMTRDELQETVASTICCHTRMSPAVQWEIDLLMGAIDRYTVRLRERDETAIASVEAERDGSYRERARLVALAVAGLAEQVVVAPATDVDEPGWQILYATIHGRQCSWHFAPGDADLIDYFDHVPADDPRAQWDGHTTDAKYQHLDGIARALGTPGPFRRRP